jgi:Holliday junction resolvase RusA-like endonuclease
VSEIRYTVPGRPVTWQRTNIVQGRPTTDKAQRIAKKAHAMYALAAMGRDRATWSQDGAFEVEVVGYWPDAIVGDADRLVGLAMDALQGLAYTTDRQVRDQSGRVRIDRENPRVEVVVRRLAVDPVQKRRA